MPRTAIAALMLVLGSGRAIASDWTYCFALERAERRFLMSRPFETTEAQPGLQRIFAGHLHDVGVTAPGNCPIAPDYAIIKFRMREAERYNRQIGNAVVPLDWPPDAIVGR